MQQLFLIGLNHRTAGVDVREAFALSHCTPQSWPLALDHCIQEAFVLSTCNRVEILVSGTDDAPKAVLESWAAACNRKTENLEPYCYTLSQTDAVRHLLSVASSLDSMILGEPQILGQMKDAYRLSLEAGTMGTLLGRLLHKTFSTAKRVRSETGIAANAVSISYAAVELAKRIFDTMHDCRAMLIGAGQMAELAAEHLIQAGVQHITIANRTLERARDLAQHFNGLAVPFENIAERLVDADIIISSTGAGAAVITADTVRDALKKRRHKPMFFIDIAVPRDIDPAVNGLDNVYVYDIDNLKETVEENKLQRSFEAQKAQCIVDEECAHFMHWLGSLEMQPTIVDLIACHQAYADEELLRTLKRLGDRTDPETVEALRYMLKALIRKIDHAPIAFLKASRHDHAEKQMEAVALARRMFALDKE